MMDQQSPAMTQQKRIILIIALALTGGVVFATGIFFVLGNLNNPQSDSVMTAIFLGITAVMVLTSFVVPPIIVKTKESEAKAKQQKLSEQEYLQIFQIKTIIAYALMEGPAFMNLAVAHQYSLPILGGLFLLMIARLPWSGRIDSWIRDRMEMQEFENFQA
ncbi:hypothetical protein [uncultured Rubinisphaera sp.]|uniref:hypothetical protein n=1 Tax=uncultured Rubinisphaera sp. TaxID=1678686 RepID=UPI0030DD46E3|tara:strand:- start:51 stop:533 length:483 start_codon:yes stop_codon:yes gene_type:complete